ncbi:MAG TPA: DUF1385 domain-containing protein, partial [Chloroflexota bacterium]|nr:DUF1385 domain-containing protein [Chloroflexota bacterium]
MSATPIVDPRAPVVRTPKIGYGGQAVLEGVMMRGRRFMAVAVRAPDGSIVRTSEALPRHLYGGFIQKIPFVRGMILLWDSLGLGMKALMFSADIQMQGEAAAEGKEGAAGKDGKVEEAPSLSKPLQWTTVAIALVFG